MATAGPSPAQIHGVCQESPGLAHGYANKTGASDVGPSVLIAAVVAVHHPALLSSAGMLRSSSFVLLITSPVLALISQHTAPSEPRRTSTVTVPGARLCPPSSCSPDASKRLPSNSVLSGSIP